MLTKPLKLDVVTFATVAVPATPTATFGSVHQADISANAEYLVETPAGHPAPLFGAVSRVKPQFSFTTPQLDTLLGALTTWGAAISAKLYQKKSTGVAPSARSGTVHTSQSIAQAVACWNQITLPARGIANGDVMVYSIYNGSASPIVSNGAVALPSGALVATNYFAAGPVYLDGVEVDGVESVTISSGVQFRSEGDASSILDTYGELSISQTVVTIKTLNPTNWSTVLLTGAGLSDLTFFAKKWANAETTSFVADGTAEHILFNNALCVATPINSTANGQGLWSDTLQILCLAPDDTHPPLTATMLQAIAAP
jgi:hypothetical protein